MRITELEQVGLKKSFSVEIEAAILEGLKNKRIKKITETVKIQGFRPGKAPATLVEAQNKNSILSYVIEEATEQAINKIYKEHKLFTIGSPAINIKNFDVDKGMNIEVSFDLFPEIPALDMKSIVLNKNVVEITEKEINKSLEQISSYYKSFEDVVDERETQLGDVAVINFVGRVEGKEFEGGRGTDFPLELGSNMFIPGFEEQLIGKKVNDKVMVNVKFPEDYYAAHLKGKDSEFEVDILKIQNVSKKIDDNLAKNSGFESLELLKEDIKKKYQGHIEILEKNLLKKELIEALSKTKDFDIPESLIEKEKEVMWQAFVKIKEHMKTHEAKGDYAEHGHSEEEIAMSKKSDEEIKAEYNIKAKEKVKVALILNDMSNKNSLSINEQDIQSFIAKEAMSYGGNINEILKYYKSNKEELRKLESRVMEEKIIDFILEQVSYNEKNVHFDDYTKKYSQNRE